MWRRGALGLLMCVCVAVGVLMMGRKEENTGEAEPETKEETVLVRDVVIAGNEEEKSAVEEWSDERITVFDAESGETREVMLEEYLVQVLAGEMPASYEAEALKAQAVAARTYIARKLETYGGSGCAKHADADICTDSKCCMACWSREEMEERWGADYEENLKKLREAVQETAGEILLYDGEPIQAVFHASSSGSTEDAVAVWGEAVPYLRSVPSGEKAVCTEQILRKEKLAEAINRAFPEAECTVKGIEEQIAVMSTSESGRVETVRLGNTTVTGRALRAVLGLRSTAFTVAFSGENVIFSVSGYGHGVGLSQCGAQAMAQEGLGYREILLHYYSGVEIGKLGE